MTNTLKCQNCGSARLVPGKLASDAHRVPCFTPEHTKALSEGYVFVHTYACRDCGNVQHSVNPEHLKDILKDD